MPEKMKLWVIGQDLGEEYNLVHKLKMSEIGYKIGFNRVYPH